MFLCTFKIFQNFENILTFLTFEGVILTPWVSVEGLGVYQGYPGPRSSPRDPYDSRAA